MKVAILGSGGQLGTDLFRTFDDVLAFPHEALDILEYGAVREFLAKNHPEAVINTAAYNRVDDCEGEVERAFAMNAFAVRNLASVCRDIGATLVHISTDYVFDGEKRQPYRETDLPRPLSAYGLSKLAGEYFARTCPSHLIVRTCGLYGLAGSRAKGGNFVETMLRLGCEGRPLRVVNDQTVAPTYTVDLAGKMRELVEGGHRGLFHVTNAGSCTWHQFASKIFALTGMKVYLRPIATQEYGAKATRPAYSVLGSAGLRRAGLRPLRRWDLALQDYLAQRTRPDNA